MLEKIVLPKLGQTMEEGTIETWHKSEGDTVEKGEVLFDLTTDKATLEVESFVEGELKKILVSEGETVPVNELVAVVGDEDDTVPDDVAALQKQLGEDTTQAAGGAEEEETPAASSTAGETTDASATATSGGATERERLFASPRAEKIAEEQEVPLQAIEGSGPNGRIIERDVRNYIERLEELSYTPTAKKEAYNRGVSLVDAAVGVEDRVTKDAVLDMAEGGEEILPMSAMRETIANRMTRSKQEVPHYYLVGRVRMKSATSLREKLNEGSNDISMTSLLVRAAGLALQKEPRVNVRYEDDTVKRNAAANVGVAVAVEDGLFVPVVKNVPSKSLKQVSEELEELVDQARDKSLTPEQYEGGSVTISNLGMYGVDYFLPIINQPESCILGIGRMDDTVVARDGAIAIEPVMRVSLSGDHRAIDGVHGAQYFQAFKETLEEAENLE